MRKAVVVVVVLLVMLMASCGEEATVDVRLHPGVDVVEINTNWIDSGAHLSIGEVYITVFSEDVVDETTLGEYEVTYNIEYLEEEYTITRMVMVVDETAPVITLLEGVDTVDVNSSWDDGGCAVSDNSGEVLLCTTESIVDTTTIGIYEVVYTSIDSSGNEGTITRIVTVVE